VAGMPASRRFVEHEQSQLLMKIGKAEATGLGGTAGVCGPMIRRMGRNVPGRGRPRRF